MAIFKIYIESPDNSGDRINKLKDFNNDRYIISPEKLFRINDNGYLNEIAEYDNMLYINDIQVPNFMCVAADIDLLRKIIHDEIKADKYAINWIKYIISAIDEYSRDKYFDYVKGFNIIYPETVLHPNWIGMIVRYIIGISMHFKIDISIMTNSAHVMETVYEEMNEIDTVESEICDFKIETYINGELSVTDYDTRNL